MNAPPIASANSATPRKLGDNVLSWATDLDEKTIEQAERSASLTFIPGHVALMRTLRRATCPTTCRSCTR